MNNTRPIGVFDSGVGGLSVVQELRSCLPGEEIIYFADTAHVPYGNRSREEILYLGERILEFFAERQVKTVVAACNTSSAVSMPILKDRYPVPIITVLEPGAQQVAAISRGKVGVMATRTTVDSQAYPRQIKLFNPELQVTQVACPQFVPLVEAGQIDGPEVEEAVQEYLRPLLAAKVDTLVLGCTHYPFLISVIKKFLPLDVQIVDPAVPTIKLLQKLLNEQAMLNPGEYGLYQYFSSGSPQSVYDLDKKLLHLGIKEVTVVNID